VVTVSGKAAKKCLEFEMPKMPEIKEKEKVSNFDSQQNGG